MQWLVAGLSFTLMPRYVAFLRGISPMNAKMPALKASFEAAGFTNVRTLLSSGNVVFDARAASLTALAWRAEKTMESRLGHRFDTIVRSTDQLKKLIASDPFATFKLPAAAKRVVTFLSDDSKSNVELPIKRDGASILKVEGSEVFSAYVRTPKGPVFMVLLEKAFGKNITTRTWDRVRKCASA